MIYGLRVFLIVVACFVMAPAAMAFQGYVQPFDETGTIAWGSGEVVVVRTVEAESEMSRQTALTVRKAVTSARKQLLDMILSVRIDRKSTVSAFLSESDEVAARVRGIVQNSPMVRPAVFEDGGEIRVSEHLRGKLAELILPTTVQFQSGIAPKLPTSMEQSLTFDGAPLEEAGVGAGGYSGVIIDARGLKVTPALAPVIYGQDGNGAYGPFLVSRQSAIEKGVVAYATTAEPAVLRERVGGRPLVVKGLSAFGSWRTDIIISTPMARLVRGVMRSPDAMENCRAVIVIDAPKPIDQTATTEENSPAGEVQ